MAYIRQIAESEATGSLAAAFAAAVRRAGRIANIIRVMSRDGGSAGASMQLYVSLMKTPNALSPARREMLAAVVSNVNECYY
jgi:predicted PhzF superfamily epimerase YddE/YHI9